MSLRPPSTPRASLLPQGTPSARRKSTPSALSRPPSALSSSQLHSLRQAVAAHDPTDYAAQDQVGIAVAGDGDRPDSVERRKAVLPGVRTSLRSSTPSRAGPATPGAATRPKTPNGFGSSTSRFPVKDEATFGVGDEVSFEVGGEAMEGTVRFIGEVSGKAGSWGGVELSPAFAGRGKNDGSVKGVHYFTCPPACGLFLPLTKIVAKPRPRPAPSAGTRAAKYAGMSAKDLAARRSTITPAAPAPSAIDSPTSPSKKPTPRRSLSPTKPRQSLSPTKPTFATPKPPTRLARPSLGVSTPAMAGRKSIGPTGTPLASSIKRPGSSLRTHSSMAAPEVPPIPSAYGRTRSVTPSSMSGRITPSTPGAMMRRRTSMASEMGSSVNGTRPTTPSFRSQSRQSLASSTSRQSQRDGDELDGLRRELDEIKHREEETRVLLEGSEKMGREMEDQLEDKTRALEEAEERIVKLEAETRRLREREEERQAGTAAGSEDETKLRETEEKVVSLERQLEQQTQQLAKTKLEFQHKSAAKEGEIESLRERVERMAKEHLEERADLNVQIDKLRTAGQALCETYEEKIAEIELARLEALELAETLQAQQSNASATSRSSSPTLRRSPSTNLAASSASAAAIDAENAQADLEHLRSRVAQLEEQLEDARHHLEQEVALASERRSKTGEVEAGLRSEIKQLKEVLERSSESDARSASRIKELQVALNESQATLEIERNELEGLRHDANGGDALVMEDLKRVSRELANVKADYASLQQDSAKNSRLVDDLRQDLRAAEKEIERLQRLEGAGDRRGSVASSIGGKDEMTSAKDQIVGLKSIISSLTEENQQLAERAKVLEEDTQELRSTQQALETTVENLMNELSSTPSQLSPSSAPTSIDSSALRRELEEMKAELKEVQRKSERDVKALNQEVAELEALIESKIYREDELETEIERYKALVAKSTAAAPASAAAFQHDVDVASQSRKAESIHGDDAEGACEMCGEKGHDLDSCPDFRGSSSPTKRQSQTSLASSSNSLSHSRTASALSGQDGNEDWCDDCEEYGHSLENCPLAAEIF
ncbi:hypothetical protein JCM10212_004868 [Sporobolomyces blumeae]